MKRLRLKKHLPGIQIRLKGSSILIVKPCSAVFQGAVVKGMLTAAVAALPVKTQSSYRLFSGKL